MRKLDINEFKICQILGRIFQKSITLSNLSSPTFIKRFMNYEGSKCFFDKSYLSLSSNEEDIIFEINALYKESKSRILYGENQMYWVGYIYGALSFLYDLPAKTVYGYFPGKQIIKYYNIYHTFDIEEAAERMMENINYDNGDYVSKGVRLYKKLIVLDKLKELIGKKVHVYIDRPLGSVHPEHENIVYEVNYGHIKNFRAPDNEYQDAYVLGIETPIEEFDGIAYAIINRSNDEEDKLIVVEESKEYTDTEIEENVSFQEKYFKHKIIR